MQSTLNNYRIEIASESGLIVYFTQPLSTQLAGKISQFCDVLLNQTVATQLQLIPSYTSVLVQYSPFVTDHFAVRKLIQDTLVQLQRMESNDNSHLAAATVELPVYYGETVAPDLARIATHHGLTTDQVKALHLSTIYRVFAIGFAPGFGYMGEVDERIAMPRLSTPRQKVPKGAVAIADRQTAVYPASSPGGWNIIGRCPVTMFDPNSAPHMPFSVGDSIKFVEIDVEQFLALGGELE